MPAQPLDAGEIGDVAAGDEDIPPTAHEVGGVEHRLELVDDIADRFALLGDAELVVEQIIGELGPRRRGPACTRIEVFLEQRAIGVALEVARTPAHGTFDDLIANHHEAVAITASAKPKKRVPAMVETT